MRVMGMISGTSHDGVDVAVVDVVADGDTLTGTLRHHDTVAYPAPLRDRLVAALPPAQVTLAEVCALDVELSDHFAEVAAVAAHRSGGVDLVCSHGQTVFHWIEDGRARGGLQLGRPAVIAEELGVPVVSDLRSRDIAAGGQGAPLVPVLDQLVFGGSDERVGVLNLGGIANLTVVPSRCDEIPCRAWDLGPANALIDAAVLANTGRHVDTDGELGAAGTVDDALLATLLAEPYYAAPPPKSTGKELFHAGYLARMTAAHPGVTGADLVATLTALTAEVVAATVRSAGLQRVVASGGGVHNPTLMRMIADRTPGIRWERSDVAGIPADAKEAVAFALIGWLTAHGLPGNVPSCTGAAGPRVLGSITPGGDRLLPAPDVVTAPRVLRFTGNSAST